MKDILDEEPKTINPPPPSSCMDSEENKKQSESPKEESTDSTAAETKASEHESVNTDDQCLEQQGREKDTNSIKVIQINDIIIVSFPCGYFH